MTRTRNFLRIAINAVVILGIAGPPALAEENYGVQIRLKANTNVRTVGRRQLLVSETILPEGAVLEITTKQVREAIPLRFWNYLRKKTSRTTFVKGVKIISAPGMSRKDIRELNETNRREGLFISMEQLEAGQIVAANGITESVEVGQDGAELYREDGPANGVRPRPSEEAAREAIARVEEANRRVRGVGAAPDGCPQDWFNTWVKEYKIPEPAIRNALAYYRKNLRRIKNKRYVTIVDYTAHSSKKRMFVLDMQTGAVTKHLAAHGKGSDPEHDGYANQNRFSWRPGSNSSPSGVHLSGEMYWSSKWNSHALRMDGQETQNRTSRARAIVLHGASYVSGAFVRAHGVVGRTQGCIGVDRAEAEALVRKLKGGSVIYSYNGN